MRHPASDYSSNGVIGDAPIAQVNEGAPHWENKYPVAANAALIAAAPELLEALLACAGALEQADTSEGFCCCGDSMERHGNPMDCGHSPVDAGDYQASQVIAQARAAIAKATGQP